MEISRLAVQTRVFPLFEIEGDRLRHQQAPQGQGSEGIRGRPGKIQGPGGGRREENARRCGKEVEQAESYGRIHGRAGGNANSGSEPAECEGFRGERATRKGEGRHEGMKGGELMRRHGMVLGLALGFLLGTWLGGGSVAVGAEILKIGNTVPLKSKEGIQIKNWLELLAERLNQAGGLDVKGKKYNVQVISYDDEYSADTGKAAAERLIFQDKVKHIVCQWGSAPIVATLQIAEPNKVLQIGNGMTEKTMEPQWNYYYRTPSLFWINGQQVEWIEIFKKRGLPMSVVIINPDDVTGTRGHQEE